MSQERIYDDFFGILTNHNKLNELTPLPDLNIHESTDYEVLMRIFEEIYINPDDTILTSAVEWAEFYFIVTTDFSAM